MQRSTPSSLPCSPTNPHSPPPLLTIGTIHRRTSSLFPTLQCASSTEEHHLVCNHQQPAKNIIFVKCNKGASVEHLQFRHLLPNTLFLCTECWLPPEEHHLVCDQQQPLPAHPPNHPLLQLASSTQEHHLCFQRYNVHHQPKNIILSAITSNPLLTIGIIQRRTSLLFLTLQCAWSTEEHHITKPHTPHPLLTIGIIQPRTLSLFSISQLTSSSKEHHLCLMQQGGFCGTLTIPTSSRWVCVCVSGFSLEKFSHHWLSTGPTGLTGPTSLTVPTRSTHCTSERIYHGTSERIYHGTSEAHAIIWAAAHTHLSKKSFGSGYQWHCSFSHLHVLLMSFHLICLQ